MLLFTILLEVVSMMQEKEVNQAIFTVMTGILINLSTEMREVVAPALG
jgi:hypothetical protein